MYPPPLPPPSPLLPPPSGFPTSLITISLPKLGAEMKELITAMFKFEQRNSAFTYYLNKNFPLFSLKRKTKGYMTTSSMNFSAIIRFLCKKGAKHPTVLLPIIPLHPPPPRTKRNVWDKVSCKNSKLILSSTYANKCRVPFS